MRWFLWIEIHVPPILPFFPLSHTFFCESRCSWGTWFQQFKSSTRLSSLHICIATTTFTNFHFSSSSHPVSPPSTLRGTVCFGKFGSMISHILFAILFFGLSLTEAFSCRCALVTLPKAYYRSEVDRFVRARLVRKFQISSTHYVYLFKVQKVFKGCPLSYNFFTAVSSTSSASCGVDLKKKRSYILPLSADTPPVLNSCQVRWAAEQVLSSLRKSPFSSLFAFVY